MVHLLEARLIDDFFVHEPLDLLFRHAQQVVQDVVVVLAQERRRFADAGRCLGEAPGRSGQ
jgi:hypothetical protein